MRSTGARAWITLLLAVALLGGGLAAARATAVGMAPTDWPMYGQNAHHTFATSTTLTRASVGKLRPVWYFRTGDAVSATPTVVRGSVFVGSWDGYFYAINEATGNLRWKTRLKAQPAVFPPTSGRKPANLHETANDTTTDGGLVSSSAYYLPGTSGRPDEVIFAGGYTLYALNAQTGKIIFAVDYPGTGARGMADPAHDSTRIFSSPVVAGARIIFGVSSDGGDGKRGYVVAASLATGLPVWWFETDVDKQGHIMSDGCGGVWGSPTLDEAHNRVVVAVADCSKYGNHNGAGIAEPYNQRVLALRLADGHPDWTFTPPRLDPHSSEYNGDPACDWDFGATANLGTLPGGLAFVGIGGKDGTYYALDPATGALRWHTRVVFGGFSGGFIGTTAFDGTRVYGATAIGDFDPGSPVCQPANAKDQPFQEPSMHALDAKSGRVAWEGIGSQSFAPTTLAGGLVFSSNSFRQTVSIRDARTGQLLKELPLLADSDGAPVVVRDHVIVPTGSSQQGFPDGVVAFAP